MKATSFRRVSRTLKGLVGAACIVLSSHAMAAEVRLGHGFTE